MPSSGLAFFSSVTNETFSEKFCEDVLTLTLILAAGAILSAQKMKPTIRIKATTARIIGRRTFLKSGMLLVDFFFLAGFLFSSSSKSSSLSSMSGSRREAAAFLTSLFAPPSSFLASPFFGSSSITSSSSELPSSSSRFSSSSSSSSPSMPNSEASRSAGSFGLLCNERAVGILTFSANLSSDSSVVINTTILPD